MKSLIWSSFWLFIASSALAGNLTAHYDMENASVLPKNIRSPRYKQVFLKMEEKYDATGVATPLGVALNKSLSVGDLVPINGKPSEQAAAEAMRAQSGVSASDSAGEVTGQINTAVDVKVPILTYGITEKWTAALVVPFYTIDVSADLGYVASPASEKFLETVCANSLEKCREAKAKLDLGANSKVRELGYKEIRSQRTSDLGDVKLISKHLLYSDLRNNLAIKGILTAPTGTRPDADSVVDTATGDGQWDIGVRAIWDYQVARLLSTTTYLGYTAQLPDQLQRRIPVSSGESLSSDKDFVYRDSGDQVEASAGLNFGLSQEFSVGVAYGYQYMWATRFSGVKYSADRYSYLNDLHPEQEVHSVTGAVGYSTIGAYRAKQFALPVSVVGSVGRPVSGRNVATSEVYSAELLLFF